MTSERQRENQRIYGAGYRAGLLTAANNQGNHPMSEKQKVSAIAGLTGTAAKVYEVVPINESWTITQIMAELKRNRLNYEFLKVEGCLGSMIEPGIIRKVGDLAYQRVELKTMQLREVKITGLKPEPEPPGATVSHASNPIDGLLAVASNMRVAGRRLIDDAELIESACIAQMEAEATHKQELEQFQQLRTLLGSISLGKGA
jgi:hypothetical protein